MLGLILSLALMQVTPLADTAQAAVPVGTADTLPGPRATPIDTVLPAVPLVLAPIVAPSGPQDAPPQVSVDSSRADTTGSDTTRTNRARAGQPVQARIDTVVVREPPRDSAIEALLQGLERDADELRAGVAQQLDQVRRTFSLFRLLLALGLVVLVVLGISLAVFMLERLARWRPAWAPGIRKAVPLVRFGLWVLALWILVGSFFGGSGLVLVLSVLLALAALAFVLFQFLRDFVGGLVLLIEQPFQVGSRVAVGEQEGTVEKIGLRSFRLQTTEGEAVVVPNAEVLRRSVRSTAAAAPEEAVTVRLSFPYTLGVDRARQLAREAAYASPYVFLGRPVAVRLADAGTTPHPTHFVVSAFAVDAPYAGALADDVLRLAHAAFERAASGEVVRPGGG